MDDGYSGMNELVYCQMRSMNLLVGLMFRGLLYDGIISVFRTYLDVFCILAISML